MFFSAQRRGERARAMWRRRSRLRLDAKVQTLSSSFGAIFVLYAKVAALVASRSFAATPQRHCIDVMTCRTGQTIGRIQRALEERASTLLSRTGEAVPAFDCASRYASRQARHRAKCLCPDPTGQRVASALSAFNLARPAQRSSVAYMRIQRGSEQSHWCALLQLSLSTDRNHAPTISSTFRLLEPQQPALHSA